MKNRLENSLSLSNILVALKRVQKKKNQTSLVVEIASCKTFHHIFSIICFLECFLLYPVGFFLFIILKKIKQ